MKKPKNYPLTSKDLAKLEKVAARVQKIHEQMRKLRDQLDEIEAEHDWLNYQGKGAWDLTGNEEFELAEVCETIHYCNRVSRIF